MRFFCSLLLLLGLAQVTLADDLARLQSLNRQLRAEMELARKPQIYVVFDLPQRQVLLKTSGVAVSTLTVKDVIHWGGMPDERVLLLASKVAKKTPQRETIQPPPAEESVTPPSAVSSATSAVAPSAEAAPKKFKLQALEIDDMPGRYQLHLEDGLVITVRVDEDGVLATLRSLADRCWWYFSRPLISLWTYFTATPYTEVILTMSLRDARQLYWSFSPGTPCLILRNIAE